MPRRVPWPSGWGPRPLVEAVDGGYRVTLSRIEQRVLQQAFDDLRVMIVNDDPSTRRLTPTAYVDDPALDEEYRQMIGDDLQASQLAAFDVVEHSIDGSTVSRDELESWMRSVNAVRRCNRNPFRVASHVDAMAERARLEMRVTRDAPAATGLPVGCP